MIKLSASIVVYSSDIKLLSEVVNSLSLACKAVDGLVCFLDVVNNNPHCENKGDLLELSKKYCNDEFLIHCIDADCNRGYGAGNNISIFRHRNSDFHLVLNPDVIILSDAIAKALDFFKNNIDVGLITPSVRGFDGTPQFLCKRHPKLFDMFLRGFFSSFNLSVLNKRNFYYEMMDQNYSDVICPVPYPTGCFMLFRRDILGKITGFDERFFLHYEDADIGRRIDSVSVTAYVPDVKILHKWSRDSHKSIKMRLITVASGFKYWWKWGGVF